MLLKISIPSQFLIVPAVNAGAILASLENAYAVRSEGWGKDLKWVKTEDQVSVEFVSDTAFEDKPAPLQKALDNYETAQSNWLAEYNKRCTAEKECAALKQKLLSIQGAVVSVDAKGNPI